MLQKHIVQFLCFRTDVFKPTSVHAVIIIKIAFKVVCSSASNAFSVAYPKVWSVNYEVNVLRTATVKLIDYSYQANSVYW